MIVKLTKLDNIDTVICKTFRGTTRPATIAVKWFATEGGFVI